jgi:hypothetical protein
MSDTTEKWWWDLAAGRAVRDEERGPDRDVLGPYPSRAEAERWRDRRDAREQAWAEEDIRWEGETEEGEPGERAP